MRRINFSKELLLISLSILLGLIMSGCGMQTETQISPSQVGRDSFSVHSNIPDGHNLTWGGFSEGFHPGEEVAFDLVIKNQSDQYWDGRFCLNLLARESHRIIASLQQTNFNLESGEEFTEKLITQLPEDLEDGFYGLSLVVRWPGDPFVDLVQIHVGDTGELRRATTQQDLNASLAACPPIERVGEPGYLAELAKTDLAQKINSRYDQIDVKSIEPVSFPDASLGVPEPGTSYAQVITPGYVIELVVNGKLYIYHASQDRVVFVPSDSDQVTIEEITIRGVQVSSSEIIVRGNSTLPDNTCVLTELWVDGKQQTWWPTETCALVCNGEWQIKVSLEEENKLISGPQYMLRAFLLDGPDVVSTFPFDLVGPPSPSP